jgi:hypothetical protein
MAPLLENIRTAMTSPRGGPQVCLVCGRSIAAGDPALKLRGGAVVHKDCAERAEARSARLGRERSVPPTKASERAARED